MKIAVTAAGKTLDAPVDPRFGRCPFFIFIDSETLDFEAIENPCLHAGQEAGFRAGQLMADQDVQYVLTGNCGPNAHQVLSARGISIIVGCSGTIREVVELFRAGKLPGLAPGRKARCKRRQWGREVPPISSCPPRFSFSARKEDTLEQLKQQAAAMSVQLRQIQERIRHLEEERNSGEENTGNNSDKK